MSTNKAAISDDKIVSIAGSTFYELRESTQIFRQLMRVRPEEKTQSLVGSRESSSQLSSKFGSSPNTPSSLKMIEGIDCDQWLKAALHSDAA